MNFKKSFFGDRYLNRKDILNSLYVRIIFVRGWYLDFPLLVFVCYLIPWDSLYDLSFFKLLVGFMEGYVRNIYENRINSKFPEYSVVYLSVVHFFGFLSFLLPIFFAKKSEIVFGFVERMGKKPYAIIFLGIINVFILTFCSLYVGAITYFGCYECSYHNKFSLIVGAIVPWVVINLFYAFVVILVKSYFSKLFK